MQNKPRHSFPMTHLQEAPSSWRNEFFIRSYISKRKCSRKDQKYSVKIPRNSLPSKRGYKCFPWGDSQNLILYDLLVDGKISTQAVTGILGPRYAQFPSLFPKNGDILLLWGDIALPKSEVLVMKCQFDPKNINHTGYMPLKTQLSQIARTQMLMLNYILYL